MRRKIKSYLPLAREIFKKIDEYDSGVITLDDIRKKFEGNKGSEELRRKLKEIIPFESISELFESLDVDDNGELEEQEFVDGVLKAALVGQGNVELAQMMRLLRAQGRKLERLDARSMENTRCINALGNAASAMRLTC